MKNKTLLHTLLLLLMALPFVLGCKKKDYPITKATPVEIDSIAAHYYEQYLKMFPLEATNQGDARYNDLLPIDIDKDFISGEIAFYNDVLNQMKNVDYASLPDDKKVIYDVLESTLKDKIEKYNHHPEYIPFTQFGGLPLDFPLLGSGEGSQPFNNEKDYENWLKRMQQFPLWMDAAIENFREGMKNNIVLPKALVVKMIPQMRAEEVTSKNRETNIFYGAIRKFPKSISAASQQKLINEYRATIEGKIIPAYLKMADFLEKEYLPKGRETSGYNALPNGNDTYRYYVRSWTTTKKSPEELHQIGLSEVARIRKEMEVVKQTLGFKGSLEEFLIHIKTDPKAMPYTSSKEVLDAFQGILAKISPKVKTMFTNLPETSFEIRQTEKFREASASAEYKPGTPDGKRSGIFYIPLPDPAKFNITSGMESLFLHEAIPGHHYQVSLQQENEALPKFMRFGWIGAYGEGWALYTESLGKELGLYKDPYQKMGALSDEMLRSVRLVVDTGLHTGEMTREEAIKYFLSNIAYEESAAVAEIERYMAMPGQALSYKTGAIKIRELRTQYEKSLGSKFKLSSFHDELLNQGCLPLEVLERKMANWAKKQ